MMITWRIRVVRMVLHCTAHCSCAQFLQLIDCLGLGFVKYLCGTMMNQKGGH